MDAQPAPHGPVDITDVLALVILVLASMRRLTTKVAEPSEYPHVPEPVFLAWRKSAVDAYGLAVQVSFFKVALNAIWFYGAGGHVPHPVLAAGGALLFIVWAVGLTIAWRRASNARIRQAELGIVLRPRDGRQRDR